MPVVESWDITELWDNLGRGGKGIGIAIAFLYLFVVFVYQAIFAPYGGATVVALMTYAVPAITVFALTGVWAVLAICTIFYRTITMTPWDDRDKFVITFFPMLVGLIVVLFVGCIRLVFARRDEAAPPQETPGAASAPGVVAPPKSGNTPK